MSAIEELTLSHDDVMVGDKIVAIQRLGIQRLGMSAGVRVDFTVKSITANKVIVLDPSGVFSRRCSVNLDGIHVRLFHVERPRDGKLVVGKRDRWNGKCSLCGRGTYVGFTSVEHDGACEGRR